MKANTWLASLFLTLSLQTFQQTAVAQPPQNTGQDSAAVIVVFKDYISFDEYRGNYHADQRAQANPAAWDYLDRGVAGAVQTLERSQGFIARYVYSSSIRGFSARLSQKQISFLQNDPRVDYVEADVAMKTTDQVLPWGIHRVGADVSSTAAGNGSGAVSNVNVYIIDTGVDRYNTDLNVINHVNFAGGKNTDCNGHGTHVAGIASARDNALGVVGVSPGAPITGVKVLDCKGSGTTSDVIKGVDWVTANAVKPAIANMSLSGSAVQSLDDAVIKSADSGVFYSIAAGNVADDACKYSPARAGIHDGVMTVAATDDTDHEAWWSNYGTCVDLWAPGVNILSTLLGGGTTTKSGTSMAAPHVGGTGALFLSSHPAASASSVEAALKANDTLISPGTTKGNKTGNTSKDGRTIVLDNASTF